MMTAQTQTRNGNGEPAASPRQDVAVSQQQWLTMPFEQQLSSYEPQFAAALPSHIKPERFRRVVVTAINSDPDLLQADRRSLFNACVRAANDGLLPDKREGALVIFNTKTKVRQKNAKGETVDVDVWKKLVQWMPMIQGILKRARNTGELAAASAHVVYERDKFRYALGDAEEIIHEPYIGADRGKPVGAYAIAKLKDGMIQREFMTVAEIEKTRAQSKAPNSLMWKDFWTEGARKTVARRMFKWLPTSADLASLFDGDDALPASEAGAPQIIPPRPTRAEFAASSAPEQIEGQSSEQADPPHDAETGEIEEGAEPYTFTLTDAQGNTLAQTADAKMWIQGVLTEMSKATTREALDAVYEGAEIQFEHLQPPELAGALIEDHRQFAANLAAAKAGKAKRPAELV